LCQVFKYGTKTNVTELSGFKKKERKMKHLSAILCMALIVLAPVIAGCQSDEEKKAEFFSEAESYFEAEDYNSAKIVLKKAIQVDPEYLEAHKLLAETHMKLGEAREAFREYSAVERLDPDNIDARLKLAGFYLLANKPEEAQKRIDLVLEKAPDNMDALHMLADLHIKNQEYARAVSTLEKIGLSDKGGQRASLKRAGLLARQERFDDAEAVLKEAIDAAPESVELKLALFEFYLRKNDFDSAGDEIRRLVEANPEDSNLYIVLGNYHMMMKDPGKAEDAYLKAVETPGDSVRPYLASARYYEAMGSTEKAGEMYENAHNADPDDLDALTSLARFHIKEKHRDEARKYVDLLQEKRPDSLQARMLKGELLVLERRYDEAITLFDQLLKEEPEAASAHYYKGYSHYEKGELGKAREALSEALQRNPEHVRTKILLAEIHLREQNYTQARQEAEAVVAMAAPEDYAHRYHATRIIGDIQLRQEQFDEAREAFQSLVEMAPKNPTGHYRLGLLDRFEGELDSAMASFQRALDISPTLMDAFSNVILIHLSRKEYDQAIGKCDAQLEKAGDNVLARAMIHNFKGRTHTIRKDLDAAEASFKSSIEASPNFAPSYYALAGLYLRKGEADEAIAQYEDILEKSPNQARPHMMLGIIYDSKKEREKAEEHYRKALEIDPKFAPAANNLAYLLADQDKDLELALGYAQTARENLSNDPSVMDTLGWVYYKKGFYDLAIAEFMDSIEKNPEIPAVHYHLGLAYHQNGENEKARAALEKALSLDDSFDGAEKAKEILSEL